MVFSSLTFLFYFLPLTLAFYYFAPKKAKNIVLLISSLFFYAWGEPIYILLMIFSSIVDYSHGLLIEKYRENDKRAKLVVLSSVIINLGLLCFFKYSDFFIVNSNSLFNTGFKSLKLPLPIGVSFYTFQTMSYTIDVYRRQATVQRSPIALATYVTLFPQLIAGPIVRYKTVADELSNRSESINLFADGIKRFIIGLSKKVLLANNIGMLWNEVQSMGTSNLPVATAWLGVIAFAFQIYFDFSGYSDMAIGLGKMFGFNFLENFNYPYISQSITEFWRRWHISLGSWFKDYVYIPLGGSRKGKIKTYLNLAIVWLLTGFWHGASWNFIIWGAYFGAVIILEKIVLLRVLSKVPKIVRHLYTLLLVLVSWPFFVFENLNTGIQYLRSMFGFNSGIILNRQFLYLIMNYGVLMIILVIASTPLTKYLKRAVNKANDNIHDYTEVLLCFALLIIATAYLVDASYNPFLYFRF